MSGWESDWVIAPGAVLDEWRTEHRLSVRDAAQRCGMGVHQFEQLTDGKARLTRVLAERIAAGTGTSATLWNNLEHNYRAGLAAGKIDATRT